MAAVDYFLKLDGIEGESTDAKHRNEIAVESFGWGLAQAAAPARGGGAGVGKPKFEDLVFVQRTSKASPKLFLACASGQHLKSAVLTARKAGKTPFEFLTIKLTDVRVSSFQEDGAAGEFPLETVALGFAKLEIVYRPQTATGASAPEVKAGWDLKLNKKI